MVISFALSEWSNSVFFLLTHPQIFLCFPEFSDLPWELQEKCLMPIGQGQHRVSRIITSAHFPQPGLGLPEQGVLRKAFRLCSFADLGKVVAQSSSLQVSCSESSPGFKILCRQRFSLLPI